MSETIHKDFHGKLARIPNPKPGYIQPFAGKLADLKWAGWADQYEVYVDGGYLCRASAAELAPTIIDLSALSDQEFDALYESEVAGKDIAATTPRMQLIVAELDRRAGNDGSY